MSESERELAKALLALCKELLPQTKERDNPKVKEVLKLAEKHYLHGKLD